MYREEEQGPKTTEELEVSLHVTDIPKYRHLEMSPPLKIALSNCDSPELCQCFSVINFASTVFEIKLSKCDSFCRPLLAGLKGEEVVVGDEGMTCRSLSEEVDEVAEAE